MSDSFTLFAVCQRDPEHVDGYAVVHPDTGDIVSNRSFPNGYCSMPLVMDEEQAQSLALRLREKTGLDWVAEGAPSPCPACGRVIWADDLDFCYPNNRERTSWRAGCNEHDFGCGYEVEGETYEQVMAAWNRLPRQRPGQVLAGPASQGSDEVGT